MRILIIGGGFLGEAIAQKLITERNEVLIFSRKLRLESNYVQIQGDIFHWPDVIQVLSWCPDIIINTAWITKQHNYRFHPLNYAYSDFVGRLATHLPQTSVSHFICLGSAAEYGKADSTFIEGESCLLPIDLYGRQKLRAFKLANGALMGENIRFTWARIFQPYGPMQDSSRLVPFLINAIAKGEVPSLKYPHNMNDWITTRDIASAIAWAINHDLKTEINVGTGVGYQNIEILKMLQRLMEKGDPINNEVVSGKGLQNMSVVTLESSLFASGWRPEDDLVSGLQWVLNS